MIHNTYLLDGEEPAKKFVVCWERSESHAIQINLYRMRLKMKNI